MFRNLSNNSGLFKILNSQNINKICYQKVKYFGIFNPNYKQNNKHEEDISKINNRNNIKSTKKNPLERIDNYRSFSKNMNQNSQSEKDKLEKIKKENEITNLKKNMENQKELNISRRNSLKKEKEKNYNERVNIIEKPNKEVYTLEEYNEIISNVKNSEVFIFKLNNLFKNKYKSLTRFAIILLFPLSIAGLFLIDFFFYDVKKFSTLIKISYYFFVSLNYSIFILGVFCMKKQKNIVLSAKLFPKDNILEITKFNYFGKIVKEKERVFDMKLKRNSWLNLHYQSTLKSKRTNQSYIFKENEAEITDNKLFNYLFPEPELQQRKKPSMVESLWEKN